MTPSRTSQQDAQTFSIKYSLSFEVEKELAKLLEKTWQDGRKSIFRPAVNNSVSRDGDYVSHRNNLR